MTINEVINRVWRAQRAAIMLAALVLLLGLTSPARAQSGHGAGGGGGAGKAVFQDLHFSTSVGVARDQMLQITVPIPNTPGLGTATGKVYVATSLGVFEAHVKVFNGLTGAEIRSFELRDPTPGLHTFDIGGSGDDVLVGGLGGDANRIQLSIQVKLVVRYDPRMKEPDEGIFPPTVEVVDKLSGKTTVHLTPLRVGVQSIWDPVL